MASAYVVNYAYVDTSAATPTVSGTAQYGDDGPANGPDPEFTLVTASDTSSGRTTWNPSFNPDGSWDSGPVAVEMALAPDGQGNDVITWTVNGEAALTETIPAIASISEVEVVAGVQLNASATWSDVSVSMSQGTTDDGYSGSNPSVDTSTNYDNPAGESELWVTPTSTGNTSVVVTGTLEFTYPAGTYPAPTDLFAGVNIYS